MKRQRTATFIGLGLFIGIVGWALFHVGMIG